MKSFCNEPFLAAFFVFICFALTSCSKQNDEKVSTISDSITIDTIEESIPSLTSKSVKTEVESQKITENIELSDNKNYEGVTDYDLSIKKYSTIPEETVLPYTELSEVIEDEESKDILPYDYDTAIVKTDTVLYPSSCYDDTSVEISSCSIYETENDSSSVILTTSYYDDCDKDIVFHSSIDLNKDGVPLEGIKIGIDPGHQRVGNSEQEAIAPGSSMTKNKVTGGATGIATGIPEYITVLDISFLLKDKLEELGATVYMTRESHDVDISNQQRTKMMNDYGVDLMLRIHCDSSEDNNINGIALYVSESNNIAQISYDYAETILDSMISATNAQNRGIVQNDNYTGQNWAEVPCIMIECGFLSNPEEDALLNNTDYQKKIVIGIVDGIIRCFN